MCRVTAWVFLQPAIDDASVDRGQFKDNLQNYTESQESDPGLIIKNHELGGRKNKRWQLGDFYWLSKLF